MTKRRVRSPRLALWLLGHVVRREDREFLLGDIEEAFREEIVPHRSAAGARRWYWHQTWTAVVSSLGDRLRDRVSDPAPPQRRHRRSASHSIGETMSSWLQDLRFAVRAYRRRPAFTALAMITLALGIGANTAIFSVVHGVLLRPLDLPRAEQLVALWTRDVETGDLHNSSGPNIGDWNDPDVFEGVYAYHNGQAILTVADDRRESVAITFVGHDAFEVLAQPPHLGRGFRPEDEGPGASPVVVLSHQAWTRRFGAATDILDRSVELDGTRRRVVGVMPAGFEMPMASAAEAWIPFDRRIADEPRDIAYFGAVGRLRGEVALDTAKQRLGARWRGVQERHPETTQGREVAVVGLKEDLVGQTRPALVMLLGATVFLLLMACANVANLLLVRAAGRRRELAVRASLGAGRGRIVRQLLVESGALAGGAAVLGVGLAVVGQRAILSLAPTGLPRLDGVTIDGTVLAFAAASATLTVLASGLLPALRSTRGDAAAADRMGSRGAIGHVASRRTHAGLVVAQVATAATLMVGAGLLLRSFERLTDVDPGFESGGVLTAELALPPDGYPERPARAMLYDELLRRAEALPGVDSAGLTMAAPLSEQRVNYGYAVEGRPLPRPGQEPSADLGIATAGYFDAMRIRHLRGRHFSEIDHPESPRVVLVSQLLAQQAWPDADPVGERIALLTGDPSAEPVWREVIGVVGDVRQQDLEREALPFVYLPMSQSPQLFATLTLRTQGRPGDLAEPVRQLLRQLEPRIPEAEIGTMVDRRWRSLAVPRFYAALLTLFALLALTLSAIGIYGILSFAVRARTGEIGVRVALGAGRPDIVTMVLRDGLGVAVIGVAVGLAAAYALSRVLAGLLYQIEPTDPSTYAAIGFLLLTVAASACLVPGLRAARIRPIEALRHE